MKSYTDLEQSRKLAEILPLDSADYTRLGKDEDNILTRSYFESCSSELKEWIDKDEIHPCWSLAALMDLLPSKFTEKGKYSETTYNIKIRKYALTEDVDLYQIAYGNYHWHEDESCSWSDMINTSEKENLIDAVFQMIIWLKENNKL